VVPIKPRKNYSVVKKNAVVKQRGKSWSRIARGKSCKHASVKSHKSYCESK